MEPETNPSVALRDWRAWRGGNCKAGRANLLRGAAPAEAAARLPACARVELARRPTSGTLQPVLRGRTLVSCAGRGREKRRARREAGRPREAVGAGSPSEMDFGLVSECAGPARGRRVSTPVLATPLVLNGDQRRGESCCLLLPLALAAHAGVAHRPTFWGGEGRNRKKLPTYWAKPSQDGGCYSACHLTY